MIDLTRRECPRCGGSRAVFWLAVPRVYRWFCVRDGWLLG